MTQKSPISGRPHCMSGLFLISLLISCNINDADDAKIADSSKNIAMIISNQIPGSQAVAFAHNVDENDQKFLNVATQINMKEIYLGKMAQDRGAAAYIKELGKMMEDQYIAQMAELKIMAALKNITIAGSQNNGINNDFHVLSTRSGKDFDIAFIKLLITANREAIATFEKGSSQSKDAQIKKWAIAAIPALRSNFNYSLACQSKMTGALLTGY